MLCQIDFIKIFLVSRMNMKNKSGHKRKNNLIEQMQSLWHFILIPWSFLLISDFCGHQSLTVSGIDSQEIRL